MSQGPYTAYIMAAGKGSRMRASLHKVQMPVAGRSIIAHVLAAVRAAGVKRIVVILNPAQADLRAQLHAQDAALIFATQPKPTGTAKAIMYGRRAAKATRKGRALLVFADTPLLRPGTLKALLRSKAPLGCLGFTPENPDRYGRILMADGYATRIIEYKNATTQQRKIGLCNGGIMMADEQVLETFLPRIRNTNRQKEYLLPDIVELTHQAGLHTAVIAADEDEVMGVDSLVGLAKAEASMQERLRMQALARGAYMPAPHSVHLSYDTHIAGPLQIDPYVVIGPGVRLGAGCHIKSFSHLEHTKLAANCQIGPFARLRANVDIAADSRVGNFVEIKNARLADGVKASHLSYLGDAQIGAQSNIGAGTITCNYDGARKHKTHIGKRVFIGSNSALVAPIKIADDSQLGAGTVATKPVPKGALLVTRAADKLHPDWALRKRKRKQ